MFDNQLPAALKKLPFDRHLSLQNVRKVISEADGYQPHLIAPEQGYRRLIDSSLGYFKGPADASVDAVLFLYFFFVEPLLNVYIHKHAHMRAPTHTGTQRHIYAYKIRDPHVGGVTVRLLS